MPVPGKHPSNQANPLNRSATEQQIRGYGQLAYVNGNGNAATAFRACLEPDTSVPVVTDTKHFVPVVTDTKHSKH